MTEYLKRPSSYCVSLALSASSCVHGRSTLHATTSNHIFASNSLVSSQDDLHRQFLGSFMGEIVVLREEQFMGNILVAIFMGRSAGDCGESFGHMPRLISSCLGLSSSLSLPLPTYLPLPVCLCLSVCLSVCLPACLPVPLSLPLSLSVSLAPVRALCSHTLYGTRSRFPSFSHSLHMSPSASPPSLILFALAGEMVWTSSNGPAHPNAGASQQLRERSVRKRDPIKRDS